MYQKTKPDNTELAKILTTHNPQKYDEIRIIFEDETQIILENLNSKYYCIIYFDMDYEVAHNFSDIWSHWIFQDIELKNVHEELNIGENINGNTYETIRRVVCGYYDDQEVCDYSEQLLANDADELKQYFMNNKVALKQANFGGTNIKGIGEKTVHIEYEFYKYNYLWEVYSGQVQDYTLNKIFNFLKQ